MLDIWVEVGVEALGAVAIFAAVRTRVSLMEKRMEKYDDKFDHLSKDFVPRSEVELALRNIEANTQKTHALVQALIYGGGNREIALKALEASAANFMHYSDAGLALTEASEELRLVAYRDAVGRLTIGWGHTGPDVHVGLVITHERAVELLRADTSWAEHVVNAAVNVPITQHQFDSMVDFVFNEGSGNFLKSTLLRELNAGNRAAAAAQFADWVSAGGKRLGGLVRRRAAEEAEFLEN